MKRLRWLGVALLGAGCSSEADLGISLDASVADATVDAPRSTDASPSFDAGNIDAVVTDGATPTDASADSGDAGSPCPDSANNVPQTLACTGLYANIKTKQIALGVREYRPGMALWSNGADKTRWISLPPGTTINTSNPNEWVFPTGTKIWKEFRVGGQRIETRFLQKLGPGNWLRGSFRWAADEATATRYDSSKEEIFDTADGTAYHIPTPAQCDDCHNGRQDFVMGFESILLGLDGAAGATLKQLADDGLLSPTPSVTRFNVAIADGGAADSAKALTWLHANCGVSCHNANPKSKGASFTLRLRLDANQVLAGPPDSTWDSLASTINSAGKSKTGTGGVRIVPGDPDHSLVTTLISGTPKMPLVETVQVVTPDDKAIAWVKAWIASLPKSVLDGGAGDGGSTDGGSDAGLQDAGLQDGGPKDGGP